MVTDSDTLVASDIERIVYNWLVRRGIDFSFQTSLMGGLFQLGGAVVDFLLQDRMLAWRVQGEYYHQGVEKTGQDILQKEMLSERGWTVVDLLGDDIKDRTKQTLTLALEGTEMLR